MKYILILLMTTLSLLNAYAASDEKLVALDVKINHLKKQVKVIEDRGEFTDKNFDDIDVLDNKIQKLMDEKLAIVERDNKVVHEELKEEVERGKRLDIENKIVKEKLKTKIEEIKRMLSK